MSPYRSFTALFLGCGLSVAGAAQQPVVVLSPKAASAADTATPVTSLPLSSKHLSKATRVELMRLLNAEFAIARKPLPMGEKGLTIKANGPVFPNGNELQLLAANVGLAAKPSQRVQVTDVEIKDKSIQLEINGGPKKRGKWYQHIEIGSSGGTTPISQNASENAKGSIVNLVFEKFVPELSVADVKLLVSPILDFTFKSAAEAYLDGLPPKVKEAIKNHEALVGMNRELVVDAKGRPIKKMREKGPEGKEFEDWMYGTPPEDVQFIRFVGDECTQVKIMPMGREMILRTTKEVDLASEGIVKPKVEDPTEAQKPSAPPPTLRRPGEAAPQDDSAVSATKTPGADKSGSPEPPWGGPVPKMLPSRLM